MGFSAQQRRGEPVGRRAPGLRYDPQGGRAYITVHVPGTAGGWKIRKTVLCGSEAEAMDAWKQLRAQTRALDPGARRRRSHVTGRLRLRYVVLSRDHFRCVLCGADASGTTLHVDHVTPASLGGERTEANLRTLCVECNLGKGNRPLPEDALRP